MRKESKYYKRNKSASKFGYRLFIFYFRIYIEYVLMCTHAHSTRRGKREKEKKNQADVHVCIQMYTHIHQKKNLDK